MAYSVGHHSNLRSHPVIGSKLEIMLIGWSGQTQGLHLSPKPGGCRPDLSKSATEFLGNKRFSFEAEISIV